MTIEAIIDATIGKEGRYSNHPSDRGGETMWGITIAVARENGYSGPMSAMPRAEAVRIYRAKYLVKPGFDKVLALSERVAEELFDTGVNMGVDYPRRWLQQWLNALNRQGRDYDDIIEDGLIGPATIRALNGLFNARGKVAAEGVLLKGLNCSQGARYLDLARNRVQNEDFVFGWLANRVGIGA